MKQPSVPFLHLLTCTQAIKAIKAIKMANDPWDHSPQTVEKPRRRLMRQSSGGCVRGAKSPPRVQSNRILKLF